MKRRDFLKGMLAGVGAVAATAIPLVAKEAIAPEIEAPTIEVTKPNYSYTTGRVSGYNNHYIRVETAADLEVGQAVFIDSDGLAKPYVGRGSVMGIAIDKDTLLVNGRIDGVKL